MMIVSKESMFVLTILEKVRETKFSQGSVTVLWRVVKKARVKLTKTQLNKLKSAAEYKTRTTLRITEKNLKMKNCLMNYF